MMGKAVRQAIESGSVAGLVAAGIPEGLAERVFARGCLPPKPGQAERVAVALAASSGVPVEALMAEVRAEWSALFLKLKPSSGKPRPEPVAAPVPVLSKRELEIRRAKVELDMKELAFAKEAGKLIWREEVLGCYRAAAVEYRRGTDALLADVLLAVSESDRGEVRARLEAGIKKVGVNVEEALGGERG